MEQAFQEHQAALCLDQAMPRYTAPPFYATIHKIRLPGCCIVGA